MVSTARIVNEGYVATNEDALKTRTITQSVTEYVFPLPMNSRNMHVYDVSGLQQHRKQWFSYFEDVHAVLFVASLSCYDQMMLEDERTNRMHDAIRTFELIGNNPLLQKPDIILFLNKSDLYKEKVKKVPIAAHFHGAPDSKEDKAAEKGIKFFKTKFLDAVVLKKNSSRAKLCHVTCCTDTKIMQKIMDEVINSFVSATLVGAGLVV
ncbi:hypothetical protein HDV03_000599 [Kappamyces sp. JEL0829]|nr:hypothetical protein HDV03_000599 [Kappamyces sp. JEL0829]